MFNSDVLVIGIVFLLLVGSLFFYLYMYVQQVDQKASLLESILLDMKVSHEITSFSSNNDSPALSSVLSSTSSSALSSALESAEQEKPYMPYSDDKPVADDTKADDAVSLEELEPLKPFQPSDELEELEELHDSHLDQPLLNYESMSLKELQSVAKLKGVSGTMKKNQLIETLKGLEQSGLKHGVVGSSFLENSALVSNDV
jgi:hypothetical protein